MNTHTRILTLTLMLAAVLPTLAQTLISPGLKLGYRFGEGGGMVGGLEISVTFWKHDHYLGFVLAGDAYRTIKDYFVGIEYGYRYYGFCGGPVLRTRSDVTAIGFRTTPYAGVGIVPFYSYQYLQGSGSEHDIGSFFKAPLPVRGPPLDWVNLNSSD